MPKIDEKHWSWIVPVILFIGLVLALAFCERPAHAAQVEPSPTPDQLTNTGHLSGGCLLLIIAGLCVAMAVIYANMRKHARD